MSALLASRPFCVVLIAMLLLRRSAAVAGGVGFSVPLVLSVTVFDIGAGANVGATAAGSGAIAEALRAPVVWRFWWEFSSGAPRVGSCG
jgi:lactate permease